MEILFEIAGMKSSELVKLRVASEEGKKEVFQNLLDIGYIDSMDEKRLRKELDLRIL